MKLTVFDGGSRSTRRRMSDNGYFHRAQFANRASLFRVLDRARLCATDVERVLSAILDARRPRVILAASGPHDVIGGSRLFTLRTDARAEVHVKRDRRKRYSPNDLDWKRAENERRLARREIVQALELLKQADARAWVGCFFDKMSHEGIRSAMRGAAYAERLLRFPRYKRCTGCNQLSYMCWCQEADAGAIADANDCSSDEVDRSTRKRAA